MEHAEGSVVIEAPLEDVMEVIEAHHGGRVRDRRTVVERDRERHHDVGGGDARLGPIDDIELRHDPDGLGAIVEDRNTADVIGDEQLGERRDGEVGPRTDDISRHDLRDRDRVRDRACSRQPVPLE